MSESEVVRLENEWLAQHHNTHSTATRAETLAHTMPERVKVIGCPEWLHKGDPVWLLSITHEASQVVDDGYKWVLTRAGALKLQQETAN